MVGLGVDRLLKNPENTLLPFGNNPRVGLLTNDSAQVEVRGSTDRSREPSRIALLEAGLNLVRIFTPEHGLSASAPEVGTPATHLGRWPIPIRHSLTLGEVALGLRLLSHLRSFLPDGFLWTPYPTAANPDGGRHLLRLLGRADVVEVLERSTEDIDDSTIETWTKAPGWWSRAGPHLLYD